MSQPPYIPGPLPSGPPPPPPYGPPVPAKKSKVGLILGIIGGVLALCCVGTIAIGLLGNNPSTPSSGASQGRALSTATPAPATPAVTPAAKPEPGDIKLTAKITHRECFGSAGCNVDFEVDMTYSGPTLSDTDTWRVTYEVHGVEDGPLIDTLDVTGTRYDGASQSASLARSSDKLTVKVTDVELR